jgi:hypothetical protein
MTEFKRKASIAVAFRSRHDHEEVNVSGLERWHGRSISDAQTKKASVGYHFITIVNEEDQALYQVCLRRSIHVSSM